MSGFDTTPEPRFLRGLQNQTWNVTGALAELVDNSYGAGRGNASRVEITYNPKTKILSVLDGGEGMRAVGELFQLGATAGRTPGDIGEYGQGGTFALLWLFQEVHVWTLRDGRVSDVSLTWDDVFRMKSFPVVSDEWRPARPSNTPEELYALGHGTMIVGRLLKARGRFHVSNVRRDLAAKFAPGVRYGKELIWRSPSDEQYLSNPLPAFAPGKAVQIDLVLETPDGHQLGVRGAIGEVPDLPLNRSKVHIGFGPRVIKETRDFFEPLDSEERYRVAGIAGWLDLLDGWQPYLATTKDDINDTPVYEALRRCIFAKIEGLLQELRRANETLLLDDIALELNVALDSGQRTEIPTDDGGLDIDYPPTGTHPWAKRDGEKPSDPEGQTTRESKAVAKLELTPMDDVDLSGRLCHAERQNGGIAVFVNSEHKAVKTALEKEPVNRLALALMVLGEVAHVLSEDEQLRKQVFPPAQFRQIEQKDDSVKTGVIHRVLMDRVHEGALA